MISTNETRNYKEIFEDYARNIKREGIEKLMTWLKSDKSDFFTAPASTKYHSNIEGGLCMHTVKVYERLVAKLPELKNYYPGLTDEAILEKIAITALFHDLCKVNFYVASTRNVKNEETGKWEKVPCYNIDDQMPLGHGEKSLFILQSFMHVERDEAAAILAHMGDFAEQKTSQCYQKWALALMMHVADIEATYLDERVY